MAEIKHHKVVASLPNPLEANSIYYVRVGQGYDQYVTNGSGTIVAYQPNAKLELDGKVDKEEGKGLSSNDYTTAEKNKLAGIEVGAQANTVDSVAGKTGDVALVKADVGLSNVDNTSDANKPISIATAAALNGKVDKVSGKQLSTEDYTTAEKSKLSGIQAGAQVNVATNIGQGSRTSTTIPLTSSTGTGTTLPSATTSLAGLQSAADKAKLNGIAIGATANATDAQLRDRTTHTGVQPIASVEGLQGVLDGKVDDTDPRLTNAREWTASVVSQAEAEAGTATTARKWTAQRVRQAAIAAWNTITTPFTRTILSRTTAAQVRSDLELGTAATRDVGVSNGNVMEVGAFGVGVLGGTYPYDDGANTDGSGFYSEGIFSTIVSRRSAQTGVEFSGEYTSDSFYVRRFRVNDGGWMPRFEILHTGNIRTTTGQSTNYPMTQKAVTDALNTKANTATQVIAGTGLSGGGTLAANRTLSVNYGTTSGTVAQGNDSRIVNATPNTRQIIAGTGLTGGGSLTADRTLSVTYGTTAGTAAQGNDSRLSDSREWTATTVSQAEAEAGTATTRRAWTSQRVRQAILGWWNTSTFKTKLDGIESGATKNATDAQLRDRATHTGVQPISSISGLQTGLDSKADLSYVNTQLDSKMDKAGSVVAVDSIADLLALPEGMREEGLRYLVKGYHAGSDVGGGEFYWDSERVDESDGGTILSPTEIVEGRFIRRLDDHVSPLYFGGRGDGVADDSAAFGAAMDVAESTGLPIKLGHNKFIVGDLSTPGVDIYGEHGSAIIAKPSSLTILDVTGGLPVHWSGFMLDGTGTSARAVKFDQVSYVTWRDISLTGFSVRCVFFEGSVQGALISGGEVSNCTGPDVFCYKGSNGKFTGVHFNDCSEHVIRFGRFSSDPDIFSRHNTVTGCSFRNIGNDPVLYEVGARGGVVSNNTFVNCRRIVKVETTADASTRDFVVSGNIFTGQIGVEGEAIRLVDVVRSVVEGNHIDGAAMGITVGAQGIVSGNYIRNTSSYAIMYSDACTVSANVLDGIGGDGIRARSVSDGSFSIISGNVITSSVLGVGVNSYVNDCVIANNTIRSQGAAVRLISSSTNTIVNGNNFRGAAPPQDSSGNSVFTNNLS